MTFLYADATQHSSLNENSIVVRLDLGQTRLLLPGDAEGGRRSSPQTAPSAHSVEGNLLGCCSGALSANILIVGHHGSKSSSRTAFLDAVGASTFIVSSGPTKYGSVTLPDAEIINELENRGAVYRTDLNDSTCGTNSTKIGTDNDSRPGGCDNIRIAILSDGSYTTDYWLQPD